MKKITLRRVAVRSAVVGALFSLYAVPAWASTLDGTATLANGSLTPLTGTQGSTTQFTVSLPSEAACSGATQGSTPSGYHVESYLIPSNADASSDNTAIEGITFTSHPSPPSYGIPNTSGAFYENQSTAVTTGQIINIPTNFDFGTLVSVDGITLSQLLFWGSSGVWEAGIACANSSGVLTDFWNTEVTFTASGGDTNGFVWSAAPGPPTDAAEVPWAAVLPVAGVAILGGGFWATRRRSARKTIGVPHTAGT